MAASFQVSLLQKSHFLGQTNFADSTQKTSPTLAKPQSKMLLQPNLTYMRSWGGRGLCNGEEGLQQELRKSVSREEASLVPNISSSSSLKEEEEEEDEVLNIPDDAFEKELLGLTGGFPGGEKGLNKFIEENPPPKKKESSANYGIDQSLEQKPNQQN